MSTRHRPTTKQCWNARAHYQSYRDVRICLAHYSCCVLLHSAYMCCEGSAYTDNLTCDGEMAYTGSHSPLVSCRPGSEYIHVLTTNVVGPFLTAKHLLPSLMKKETRVIINISSLYDSINATLSDNGHQNATGSVLLASNTSKAAINMRKF